MTNEPLGRPNMYMRWENLAFFHWPVPVDALRPLVPAELSIDTFEGTAFIGLVPFTMPRVRHATWPTLPTMRRFHECNVRTYVSVYGRPGVWFFSLDAESRLAVWGARTLWNLPYVHAHIELERDGSATDYSVQRVHDPDCRMRCRWEAGEVLPRSEPGDRNWFLTERYALYTKDRRGRILRGDIRHDPWPLRKATILELEDDLVAAGGIEVAGPPICLHADRLDVAAWSLRPAAGT